MPADISERYKLIFAEHHYASDFRVKIFTGWCALYAALAAAFVWIYSVSKPVTWVVAVIGIGITLLMWSADIRNRAALRSSKNAGAAIEEAESIPPDQRFFTHLKAVGFIEKLFTHSKTIDCFALGAIVLLVWAAIYLFRNRGVLPV
jgi:hypothetical protein